ncbi:glycosyltransferase [Anabaena lutea]|uniref:Glycosyltransferase n=1 Tax=Anabaena lutea FACHB-196 TaxID=2692881 RepID=A0ABR8FQV9_9NOST|nr:glycosyltransferase [Anabaena lutea]MBD2571270.1 glycosyltransferase [Anabaena lutea FACHB-196]
MSKTLNYRIIHLSKYYPPDRGGIETHVQTLAQTQAALGAEVHVVCVNAFNEQGQLSSSTQTVKEMDGNVSVTRMGRLLSLARFDVCPELPKKVCQLAKQSNTLLHLHTPNPTMLIALTMLHRRVPLIITHHSDVIKQKVLKYGLRPFEHLVYSRSSQVLTTSSPYIQGSKFLRFYRDKLSYLPLGLDASNYSQPNKRAIAFSHSLKNKYPGPIWLAVGRLVYYKALHVAIEALTMVKGTLVIIGVGSLEQELKTLAKKLGVDKRIVWLGHVNEDELVGAYHAATSLWFPSNIRSEGFGLVQVEAMASGCPVINANIPCSGVPWVSRHEQEGLTVPINNPVALAEASQRLLREPGLRNRLAAASRKRAEYFNHTTMAQRSFKFYEEVLHQERNYAGIPKPVDLL